MICLSFVEFVLNLGKIEEFFVEFVEGVFFVDFELAQNLLLPTTSAQFSVREILKFATSKIKWQISRFHSPQINSISNDQLPKYPLHFPRQFFYHHQRSRQFSPYSL